MAKRKAEWTKPDEFKIAERRTGPVRMTVCRGEWGIEAAAELDEKIVLSELRQTWTIRAAKLRAEEMALEILDEMKETKP